MKKMVAQDQSPMLDVWNIYPINDPYVWRPHMDHIDPYMTHMVGLNIYPTYRI